MRAGRVDCLICSVNVVVELRRNNEPVEVWSTDRYAPMPSQGYVATRRRLEEKSELFVRVLKGLHASVTELMTQPTGPIYERAARQF